VDTESSALPLKVRLRSKVASDARAGMAASAMAAAIEMRVFMVCFPPENRDQGSEVRDQWSEISQLCSCKRVAKVLIELTSTESASRVKNSMLLVNRAVRFRTFMCGEGQFKAIGRERFPISDL
jgi:hypothetical protein